jgi:hypothetical protein
MTVHQRGWLDESRKAPVVDMVVVDGFGWLMDEMDDGWPPRVGAGIGD